MKNSTCSFFGHRDTKDTPELRKKLNCIIENLINKSGVDTFLFGSRSRFNDICCEEVTNLKKKYPHIRRIYVRAEYPDINEDYKTYLLKSYDDTYFPEGITNAHKAVYVERNLEMIEKSRFCVFYCNKYASNINSGTKKAFNYAEKLKKEIIMI